MKLHRIAAATALGMAGLTSALAAPTLSILPGQQNIAVGALASVDIVISGLSGAGEIVSAYDLDVLYNTGLLSAAGVTQFLGPLGGLGNTTGGVSIDNIVGSAGGDLTALVSDAALVALQGDSFTLMTLSFIGLADGVSFLNFGADPDLQRLVTGRLDGTGFPSVLDLTYVGACISVGTGSCPTVRVPEPASYGLAGLALLGCGLATTRRRRAGAPAAG